MAKKTAKAEVQPEVEAVDGGETEATPDGSGRKQHTADGAVGTPVEELSQTERREVGRKLAEGAKLADAEAEAKPLPDAKPE